MITCKNCKTVFDADYKFCPTCGKASDMTTCPSCYAPVPAGSSYCPKCASPITHTEKCAFCGGMNAKNSKFCSVCGKMLKSPAELTADVARIRAAIPMLREALEAREVHEEPALTKKELRGKRKIEKLAAKYGLTIVDPDEVQENTLEEDLLAAVPEHTCDCCEPDPVVEMLKEQNKNLEAMINKIGEKVAQPAAPVAPMAPAYPYLPCPMPYYQPAPAPAPAAPSQPIVIQQPAPSQPIVIQQPATPAEKAPAKDAAGQTIIINNEGEGSKKSKKRRFLAFLMFLLSAGFLAVMALASLPTLIIPATEVVSGSTTIELAGGFSGLDLARAFFCVGGEGMAMIAGENALTAAIATLTLDGADFCAIAKYVSTYANLALVLLSIVFMAFDVLMGLVRIIRGKIRKRRGLAVRISLLCYLLFVLSIAITTATTAPDFMGGLTAVFTQFMAGEGAEAATVTVFGLGGIAGLGILVLRLFLNVFIKKSK